MSSRPRVTGYTFAIGGSECRISLEQDGTWHAWMGKSHVGTYAHPQFACDVLCRFRYAGPPAAGRSEVTLARVGLPYDLAAWDANFSLDG
jgi:hypothetical protein